MSPADQKLLDAAINAAGPITLAELKAVGVSEKLAIVAMLLLSITRPELEAWAAEQRERGLDPDKVEDSLQTVVALGLQAARHETAGREAQRAILGAQIGGPVPPIALLARGVRRVVVDAPDLPAQRRPPQPGPTR